ncbi:hypothetical protein AtubIFM54640_003807 [Aspergillus tubingensis]|nr:hypothetical protein AtubIFM54640_003807 [Aspergillus tubingensis]
MDKSRRTRRSSKKSKKGCRTYYAMLNATKLQECASAAHPRVESVTDMTQSDCPIDELPPH